MEIWKQKLIGQFRKSRNYENHRNSKNSKHGNFGGKCRIDIKTNFYASRVVCQLSSVCHFQIFSIKKEFLAYVQSCDIFQTKSVPLPLTYACSPHQYRKIRFTKMTRVPSSRKMRKNPKPTYNYVDPVTLQPLSARARGAARARAQDIKLVLPKWRITMSNVQLVTTLVLLLERAKTLRASYKSHWEVIQNTTLANFMWTSQQGTGAAVDRQERFLAFIEDHLPLIECYDSRILLKSQAWIGWKNVNRSSVSRHSGWEDVKKAIEQELACVRRLS